ncbi:TonB-dependent siderophore receptor [Actomonas aquatica]|uniref:TonB-dependent receptor plug domain-containing protein n=1 Tax=Actomonas aquatica TaxID=2866162 RepID=A0ABZ1C3M4_9BACT|nr:TonB-dependent receptor plug domain-containing protein [Opitutus sp. WL0086]WRQ86307.1 TonB-dependent receptor plug domain-containing protein [Opitutus sp. WL0086]
MTLPAVILRHRVLACLGLLAGSLGAQSTPSADTVPAGPAEPTVVLPAFVIEEETPNPYQSNQALSASRVATSIQDIPQTISVVTSDFLKDTMSTRMLDAAKYITPVVESTLPVGGDRYMIRGFQVSHEFIDGTEISGQDGYSASLPNFNIERIEIIKGPNAILVPGGSPGGQFNPITKSPIIGKDQSSVSMDWAQYGTTSVSTDLNRIVNDDMAVRLVAAYWDNDGYTRGYFRTGYLLAPSFAWQLSDNHKLNVKAEFMQNRETTLVGLPIDPSVGSDDYAFIARGLPRDFSFGNDQDFRHRATERLTVELLSNLGNHVTSRLQFMANHVVREDQGGTSAAIAGIPVTRNPTTGKYEPGITWSVDQSGPTAVPSSTPSPIPDPSTWLFTRNNGAVDLFYTEGHFRNDYAAKFEEEWFNSTTIAGVSANYSRVQFKAYPAAARPSILASDLDSITFPDRVWPQPSLAAGGGNRTGRQQDLQLFVYENLGLLDDRILLSGGVSRYFGNLQRIDDTGLPPAITDPDYSLSTTAKTLGLVVKPIEGVSLFYSFNSSGGTMPSSLNPGTYGSSFRAAAGEQDEFGVKLNLFEDRLTASVAYFDISQQNYAVPNSDYYTLVAQGRQAEADLLPNPLYLDLNSKGWEAEFAWAVNKNLTLIGNFTSFEIRQPITEVRVRAVPDQNGAIYADYQFGEGALSGFGVNIGIDYKGDVVGENATGYTTSTPLPGDVFVPNQPTFLVDARTLVNLGFSYKSEQWTSRLQFNNVLDKDYILAAGSRTAAVPGNPFNVKASFTYKF